MSDRGAQYDRGYIDGLISALSQVQTERSMHESVMRSAYDTVRMMRDVRGTDIDSQDVKDWLRECRQEVNDSTQPLLEAEERIYRFLEVVENNFQEDYPDMDPDHDDYVSPMWA